MQISQYSYFDTAIQQSYDFDSLWDIICVRQIQFFAAEDINPFPVIPDVVNKLSYKLDISELNSLSETDSDSILKTY